ncbi:MAG: FecR domain-containing protein [Pseudomonadota bacterium]
MSTEITPQVSQALQSAHDWRLLLTDSEATDQDRKQFQSWLAEDPSHEQAYQDAVSFWSALGKVSAVDLDPSLLRPTTQEKWTALKDRWSDLFLAPAAKIAAAGMLGGLALVGAVFLARQESIAPSAVLTSNSDTSAHVTDIGQTRIVTLSDGSQITLGAASEMEASIDSQVRTVRLISGSAFFEVASDPARPFSVTANELEATVLGTTFNVHISGGTSRVAVAEGAVVVTHPFIIAEEATSILSREVLSGGQQVEADSKQGLQQVETVDPQLIGAWRQNRLIYSGSPLTELVADANRYSVVPVEISADARELGDLRIRGAFNAQDIDGMLSILTEIHPVSLDRADPARVVIRLRNPKD